MSKKLAGVVALAGMCALSLLLLNCGSSSDRPSGVLYVLTQGSNGYGNNISSFTLDYNNGELSLVNSDASTCPTAASVTDPQPCGLPLNILLDPAGATAFVLNQGAPPCPTCSPASNNPLAPSIYPFTVNSDGSLSNPGTAVTWSCPTANQSPCNYSDTAVAMTRDATGQFLFVIDYGTYPTPGYPNPTPYPSCPHVPTKPDDVCPSISVFAMNSGSAGKTTLTLAPGSPFYLSNIPSALSSIIFTPPGSSTPQELLFVTNNQDICAANCVLPPHSDNTVSVYSVSSSGALSETLYSPYVVAAVNPISVQAVYTNLTGENAGGLFLYVGNQDANGGHLYPFEVCTVLSDFCTAAQVSEDFVSPLATCPQPSCDIQPTAAGSNPIAMVVDPTNNFLYVVSEVSSQVFEFRINLGAGTLTPLNPASQPTGSQPVSMTMHPSVYVDGSYTGQFLYTSNIGAGNITGWTLSTTTGAMSNGVTEVAPAAPGALTAH
ncbi:MAG: beta-propeller fold lactonase family protein [Terriglobales bacterium]